MSKLKVGKVIGNAKTGNLELVITENGKRVEEKVGKKKVRELERIRREFRKTLRKDKGR